MKSWRTRSPVGPVKFSESLKSICILHCRLCIRTRNIIARAPVEYQVVRPAAEYKYSPIDHGLGLSGQHGFATFASVGHTAPIHYQASKDGSRSATPAYKGF